MILINGIVVANDNANNNQFIELNTIYDLFKVLKDLVEEYIS